MSAVDVHRTLNKLSAYDIRLQETGVRRSVTRRNLVLAQIGIVRTGVRMAILRDPEGKAALEDLEHALDTLGELVK